MKNTVRARLHGATKPVSAQTKTSRCQSAKRPTKSATTFKPRPELALPDGDCHPSCLAVFDREDQEAFLKIPLSEDEFKATVNYAGFQKRPMHHVVADAIRDKIYVRRDMQAKSEELNQAVAQANVLLELIESHLDYREHRNAEDFTGKRADEFNFGLAMLSDNTRTRLTKSAAAVHDAAYANRSGVAT